LTHRDRRALTSRVELVAFGPEHFGHLIEWSPTAEFLLQWAGPGLRFPLDREQLQALVDGPDRLFTAMEDDRVIGHAQIGRIDPIAQSAWLMRILIGEPADRGRGLGRAIVAELLRVAFDDLGLERVYLHVLKANAPAIALYGSFGFEACESVLPRPDTIQAMVLERTG
jgi:RimJ/RimL family protein N-acetyltransferase